MQQGYSDLAALIPVPPPLQKDVTSEQSDSNLLSKSALLANDMDGVATSTHSSLPLDLTWSTGEMSANNSIVITPPPEGNKLPPPYPYPNSWANYGQAGFSISPSSTSYGLPSVTSSIPTTNSFYGSSLEYSPISSPGSTDSNLAICESQLVDDLSYSQPAMTKSHSPLCSNYFTEVNMASAAEYNPAMTSYISTMAPTTVDSALENKEFEAEKEVKMPQRKGGIQLWQFLHYLLTNPEKKHKDLIEWTSNMHLREFRMLEPEAIAVWWGHHKNKPGMTYDKFSRSLRYYYDKGILKKIPGERYVYRFLIDPEVMYHHIGTSECRPKVKPMPKAAKAALTKFHKTQNIDFKAEDIPRITQEAEPLAKSVEKNISAVCATSEGCWNASHACRSGSNSFVPQANLQFSFSAGNLTKSDTTVQAIPTRIKRCKSLENPAIPSHALSSSCPLSEDSYRGISPTKLHPSYDASSQGSGAFSTAAYDTFYSNVSSTC